MHSLETTELEEVRVEDLGDPKDSHEVRQELNGLAIRWLALRRLYPLPLVLEQLEADAAKLYEFLKVPGLDENDAMMIYDDIASAHGLHQRLQHVIE